MKTSKCCSVIILNKLKTLAATSTINDNDSEVVCVNSNGEWEVQHAAVVTRVHGARTSHCNCHC